MNALSIDQIEKVASEVFEAPGDIYQRTRKQEYVFARQGIAYFLKYIVQMHERDIAQRLKIDRVTVLYSVNKVEQRIKFDKDYRDKYIDFSTRAKQAANINPPPNPLEVINTGLTDIIEQSRRLTPANLPHHTRSISAIAINLKEYLKTI
jgi:hypothetical protein